MNRQLRHAREQFKLLTIVLGFTLFGMLLSVGSSPAFELIGILAIAIVFGMMGWAGEIKRYEGQEVDE